jgi:hypothetical protein
MVHITYGTTYVHKPSIHEVSPANSYSMTPSTLPLKNASIVIVKKYWKQNASITVTHEHINTMYTRRTVNLY